MTTTNLTRKILEDFEFADENPLVTNDWLTNTSGDLLPVKVEDGVVKGALAPGVAWIDKAKVNTPKHADQEVRAIGYSMGRNISTTISKFSTTGANTNIELKSGLLTRAIGEYIRFTIAGDSGLDPSINGTYVGLVTSAVEVRIFAQTHTGTMTPGTTIVISDCFFSVMSRVDSDITTTAFSPLGGYKAELAYDQTAFTAKLYRWERDSFALTLLKTAAVDLVVNTLDANTSDGLGVLQELRLTVVDEASGGTRLKVYVNGDDDSLPAIEFVDDVEVTTKVAGVWGFELGATSTGIDAWYASDKFADADDGNQHVGRQLSELRVDLRDEITRGTGTSLDDAFLDRAVNRAVQFVMKSLGSLAWWRQREETMTLTSVDTRTFELPPYVESVEAFFRAEDRHPHGNSIWAIGPNAQGTALKFQSALNFDGQAVIVRYYLKWTEMEVDTDRCPIPREHDELVVISAAMNIARRTGDQSWMTTLNAFFGTLLKTSKTELNRQKRQQKTTLRVHIPGRINRHGSSRYLPDSSWAW